MKRSAQRTENVERLYRAGLDDPEVDIRRLVGNIAGLEQCSTTTVYRILRDAGLSSPRTLVREPKGEQKLKRGQCLMCKAGRYKHPAWPGGKCPTCNGTGRYPASIMEREKQENRT